MDTNSGQSGHGVDCVNNGKSNDSPQDLITCTRTRARILLGFGCRLGSSSRWSHPMNHQTPLHHVRTYVREIQDDGEGIVNVARGIHDAVHNVHVGSFFVHPALDVVAEELAGALDGRAKGSSGRRNIEEESDIP